MQKGILAAILAAGLTAPAFAAGEKAEVVERDAKGRATKVSVGGVVYTVCVGDMSDGCINPREAGLNFGNVPLNHWPGRPASEGGK